MNHPGVAQIDCEDCCRRLYNLETGRPETFRAGPDREERFYEGPGHKPPCRQSGRSCPKGTPETRHERELSEDNWKTWNLFNAIRATAGRVLTDDMARDPILAANLATLERIVREHETRAAGEAMAMKLVELRGLFRG